MPSAYLVYLILHVYSSLVWHSGPTASQHPEGQFTRCKGLHFQMQMATNEDAVTHRMNSTLGPTGPMAVQTARSRSLFVHTFVVPSAGCWLSWNEETNLSRRRRRSTQEVDWRKKYRNCEAILARESSITQSRSWVRAQILYAASLGIDWRAAGWFVLVSSVAVVYWLGSLPSISCFALYFHLLAF